jgi:hypothetical protein
MQLTAFYEWPQPCTFYARAAAKANRCASRLFSSAPRCWASRVTRRVGLAHSTRRCFSAYPISTRHTCLPLSSSFASSIMSYRSRLRWRCSLGAKSCFALLAAPPRHDVSLHPLLSAWRKRKFTRRGQIVGGNTRLRYVPATQLIPALPSADGKVSHRDNCSLQNATQK